MMDRCGCQAQGILKVQILVNPFKKYIVKNLSACFRGWKFANKQRRSSLLLVTHIFTCHHEQCEEGVTQITLSRSYAHLHRCPDQQQHDPSLPSHLPNVSPTNAKNTTAGDQTCHSAQAFLHQCSYLHLSVIKSSVLTCMISTVMFKTSLSISVFPQCKTLNARSPPIDSIQKKLMTHWSRLPICRTLSRHKLDHKPQFD